MTLTLGGFPDVMVDVETTSTSPDRGAILQLGAVRFNKDTQKIDHDMFNRCMTIPPTRHWGDGTKEWWASQRQDVYEDIIARAEPPEIVMKAFFDWSCEWPNPTFWAKPLSFDFPFTAGYFRDYGYQNPYHYRKARDLNSYVEALHYPERVPEVTPSDLGPAHNALNDCLMQIEHLFQHIELRKKRNAASEPVRT